MTDEQKLILEKARLRKQAIDAATARRTAAEREMSGQGGKGEFTSRLDPSIVDRFTFLPVGKKDTGEFTAAIPQAGVDFLKGAELPGRVLSGQQVTQDEMLDAATNAFMPGLSQMSIKKGLRLGKPKTSAALKKEGGPYFDRARESSAIVARNSVKRSVDELKMDLNKEGFDPDVHPETAKALRVLDRKLRASDNGFDLQDLMNFRSIAATAAEKTANSKMSDVRLGTMLVAHFDDFVNRLGPGDLLAGSPDAAGALLKKGRSIWTQMHKTRTVEKAIEDAALAASGFENGLRSEFRKILKNEKKAAPFTMRERKLMKDIVEGTMTINTLKGLSKLGGGVGSHNNWLGGFLSSSAGGAIGGGLGGPIGAGVGIAAPQIIGRAATALGNKAMKGLTEDILRSTSGAGMVPGGVISRGATQGTAAMGAYSAGRMSDIIDAELERKQREKAIYPTGDGWI